MEVNPRQHVLLRSVDFFQSEKADRDITDEQDTVELSGCGLPTMFTEPRQRRLRRLWHVRCKKDEKIPRNIWYGELIAGNRNLVPSNTVSGCIQEQSIDLNKWEQLVMNCSEWRCCLKTALKVDEKI